MKGGLCELCDRKAVLYCPSDSAFLCWNCDAKVHQANFLASRHVRCTVCSRCKKLTDNLISGVGFQTLRRICRSCSHESLSPGQDLDSLSSSSSSACISTAESCASPPKKISFDRIEIDDDKSTDLSSEHFNFPAKIAAELTSRKAKRCEAKTKIVEPRPHRNIDSKADEVLVNWCRKLGMASMSAVAVPVAINGFAVCLKKLTVFPYRVLLAASLWHSLRLRFNGERRTSTLQVLKRLEDISGVPAKLILAAESKLAPLLTERRLRSDKPEEGWAESSV
ncbi:hypothetical protein U1Q18_006246 [Sarracenia purpurea var. burkii]